MCVCVYVDVCGPIIDFKNISYLTIPSFDFLYYMSCVLIKSNYFRSQDAFWWEIGRGMWADVWGDSRLIRALEIESLQHTGHIIILLLI